MKKIENFKDMNPLVFENDENIEVFNYIYFKTLNITLLFLFFKELFINTKLLFAYSCWEI